MVALNFGHEARTIALPSDAPDGVLQLSTCLDHDEAPVQGAVDAAARRGRLAQAWPQGVEWHDRCFKECERIRTRAREPFGGESVYARDLCSERRRERRLGDVFSVPDAETLDLLTGPPRLREKRAADDRRYGHRDLEAPQRILYVTSEIADFVKAGGLGEVSAALPRSLRQQYDVRILIPGYRQVLERYDDLPVVGRLPAAFGLPACDIGRLDTPDGLILYVLLCPDLYDREGSPYGDAAGFDWSDNDVRFARLALAAAKIACGLRDLAWTPDLLHLNDWTSALTPRLPRLARAAAAERADDPQPRLSGLFEAERLSRLGVPESAFQIEGVEFYGKLSFLKAGIVYSSHVTTVSSTYAREITTPELGCGLDGLLRVRADEGRLTGILNGIDESWDPRTDPYLASPFEAENLKGKAANRDEVRKEFGLAVSRGPLFAVVSRLVHQKGVDLAIEAAEAIVRDGGQIVVTGRGEDELEQALEKLAARYPDGSASGSASRRGRRGGCMPAAISS